ncbi:MAG: hypothetical protein KDI42_05445 [Gammaproteobacteria bacterium]|nr:hypothetical protein [Gammaproteobacteria bacterium]
MEKGTAAPFFPRFGIYHPPFFNVFVMREQSIPVVMTPTMPGSGADSVPGLGVAPDHNRSKTGGMPLTSGIGKLITVTVARRFRAPFANRPQANKT